MSAEVTSMLIDRLARIEEKLDRLADERLKNDAKFEAVDRRVDKVERFMWIVLGIALTSGASDVAKFLG